MERRGGKKRMVELGKDLLIVALLCSAVALLGRTQLINAGGDVGSGWLSSFLSFLPEQGMEAAPQPVGGWGGGGVIRPVRVVLTSSAGRYGVQYDSEKAGRLFSELQNPLSDALAGAQAPERSTARAWREALTGERPCVYLDFLGEIPLADLSSWLSDGLTPNETLTGTARRLLLTLDQNGGALLYYINEADGMYYACRSTADLADRLEALINSDSYPFNSPKFAFEDPEQYGDLDPLTLLGALDTARPTYTAADPLDALSLEDFVSGLGFHPQTYASYPIPEGVAIHEGGDRLTVGTDGTVTYWASEDETHRYSVAGRSGWAMVDGAWAFVERTVGPLCGAAQLYLSRVESADGGGFLVTFGYQLDGAEVRVGTEGWAAQVLVRDGAILGYTLQLRTYTATGATSVVMQEPQALGALRALEAEGAELVLCYRDQGGDTVAAGWIAR